MSSYGVGASLANYAQAQQQDATQALGEVARDEASREMGNKVAEQQRKAGNRQLGAMGGALVGMQYGAALGPWGALAGAAVGTIAGGLF